MRICWHGIVRRPGYKWYKALGPCYQPKKPESNSNHELLWPLLDAIPALDKIPQWIPVLQMRGERHTFK